MIKAPAETRTHAGGTPLRCASSFHLLCVRGKPAVLDAPSYAVPINNARRAVPEIASVSLEILALRIPGVQFFDGCMMVCAQKMEAHHEQEGFGWTSSGRGAMMLGQWGPAAAGRDDNSSTCIPTGAVAEVSA